MEHTIAEIAGYNGRYLMSPNGTIMSNGVEKKAALDKKTGYYKVQLWINNKRRCLFIHRLIAIHFIPNPENKPQVNHKNGIKTDNRIENLEWSTYSENLQHSYDIGLHKKGDQCSFVKLKERNIRSMRRLYKMGIKQKQIAEMFNISQPYTSQIVNSIYRQ